MWIEFLLIFVLSLCVAKLFFVSRDLLALDQAINKIGPDGIMPRGIAFKNRQVQKIFTSIALILSKFRPSNFEISQEAIAMGTLIASQVFEPNGVALVLADVLKQKISTDLVGVAVLTANNGKLRISQSAGLPLKRIGLIIESSSQLAFESQHWGYQHSITGGSSDFSIFGIKRILLVPVKYKEQVEGVIWLGLSSSVIAAEKAEMVKALAEYAAASFQTARRFGNEKEFQQREKDFLLGLSHDLRSPGNRALFCVRDLLFDATIGQSNREQLEIIEHSINEQMEMINDVLDIAKHQGGVLVSKPVSLNLHYELEELKSRFSSDLSRKNLLAEFSCALNLTLYVDASHFKRILNNLMSNAIKFTNFGGIFIEVEVFEDFVEIVFKDTGSGVCEQLPVFQKFTQGDNSKGQSSKLGYGLGLSLVKALVEINNGEVLHYSSSFAGANFGVRLPTLAYQLRANS